MPDGDLQDGSPGAMVDGQCAIDLRYLDIAHDAVTGHIQLAFVVRNLGFRQDQRVGRGEQVDVVILRLLQNFLVAGVIDPGHIGGVAVDCAGLVQCVPGIADRGIKQQGQSCH